jgi:hypothetical protein
MIVINWVASGCARIITKGSHAIIGMHRHQKGQLGGAFGGSERYVSSHRGVIPQTPHFEAVNGDSQLKRSRAYLGKGETYFNIVILRARAAFPRSLLSRSARLPNSRF